MKGFKLDANGDVIISNGDIAMIDGDALLVQTMQTVLGTNKGEWVLNENEGITFSNILGKGNTEDMIRNEIQQGITQIDETYAITAFEMNLDTNTRKLRISFTAQNSGGNEVSGVKEYA